MIGVNSDGLAENVAKIVKENGITWRQAIDGTTSGPIATAWDIRGWPTVFVLDEEGVIRSTNARGKMLDETVEALLKQLEKKKNRKSDEKPEASNE